MTIQELQIYNSDLSNNKFRIVEFDNFNDYISTIRSQQKNIIEIYNDGYMVIYKFFSSRLKKDLLHIGKVVD